MGKKTSITIIVIFILFLALQAVYPQNRTDFPRLTPDPKALDYFRQGNYNYSWEELAEISLWASGDTGVSNMQRISNAVTTLINSGNLPANGRERAEYILTYMHANFLRAYSLYQTRVDTIFTNGRFNCVSSAVLYMIFCKAAGINSSGVMTRDHAFITVHIDGEDIDVETTNRFGFDPGNRREFHDELGRVTGFSYVPAQNYRDRQTISQIELISLIFNNRVADFERANRYAEAVPLSIDRFALLSGNSLGDDGVSSAGAIFSNPRTDLIDRLLNYGASILRAGREEDALHWAASASERYPEPGRWAEFTLAAVNNRIARLIRERRLQDARTFLENNRNLILAENYSQFDIALLDSELYAWANQTDSAAEAELVLAAIEQALFAGKIEQRRASELITFTVLKIAAILCAPPQRDWRAAVVYMEAAISRFGENRDFLQAIQTYRNNIATDYHNRFAAEWNRRNYEEAERILNEGLAEFPTNRQLLSNLEIVNRNRR